MLRKLLCLLGLHDWRNAAILHADDRHEILVQSCECCNFGRIYTKPAGAW